MSIKIYNIRDLGKVRKAGGLHHQDTECQEEADRSWGAVHAGRMSGDKQTKFEHGSV